jgi:hypothetical protein
MDTHGPREAALTSRAPMGPGPREDPPALAAEGRSDLLGVVVRV